MHSIYIKKLKERYLRMKTIDEIACELGFKYPQHRTIFKQKT